MKWGGVEINTSRIKNSDGSTIESRFQTVESGGGGASANPTSGKLPYNNAGAFADSMVRQGSGEFRIEQPTDPFGAYGAYGAFGLKLDSNEVSLGYHNGNVLISNDVKMGIGMSYSSFDTWQSFGRTYDFGPDGLNVGGNLEGFYHMYGTVTAMGAGDSSLAINSTGELALNGTLGSWADEINGFRLPAYYYRYIQVKIGRNTYKIPLFS